MIAKNCRNFKFYFFCFSITASIGLSAAALKLASDQATVSKQGFELEYITVHPSSYKDKDKGTEGKGIILYGLLKEEGPLPYEWKGLAQKERSACIILGSEKESPAEIFSRAFGEKMPGNILGSIFDYKPHPKKESYTIENLVPINPKVSGKGGLDPCRELREMKGKININRAIRGFFKSRKGKKDEPFVVTLEHLFKISLTGDTSPAEKVTLLGTHVVSLGKNYNPGERVGVIVYGRVVNDEDSCKIGEVEKGKEVGGARMILGKNIQEVLSHLSKKIEIESALLLGKTFTYHYKGDKEKFVDISNLVPLNNDYSKEFNDGKERRIIGKAIKDSYRSKLDGTFENVSKLEISITKK